MENVNFIKVNKDNEKELFEYESAFYSAFSQKDSQGWVLSNYQILDGKRLRSRVLAVEDQEFYVCKNGDQIVLGASINFNKKVLQYEQMGFHIENHQSEDFCEGLIFFSIEEQIGNFDFPSLSASFFEFMKKDLINKNIKLIYGTCSRNLKAMYSLLGYKKIDSLKTEQGLKLLMKMEIEWHKFA